MSKPLLNKGFTPLSQLSVFLGIWGACFILAVFATLGISLLGGLSLTDTGALLKPENRNLMVATQVASTFFVFGLPAVGFSFVCYRNGWDALGLGKGWEWKAAMLAILIMLVSGPLTENLGELNKAIPLSEKWRNYFDSMEKTYEAQVKSMLNVKTVKGLLASLVLVAALPALFEELFFRGGMQGLFMRWLKRPWLAILITSLIFSAIHFSWYGFIPRVMLGVVLGVVYYSTGNLWYSILMHFVNNAAAVLYMYVLQQQGKAVEISNVTVFPGWAWSVSLVLMVILIMQLLKISKPEPVKEILQKRNAPFETNP